MKTKKESPSNNNSQVTSTNYSSNESKTYVVLRDGYRVSDAQYQESNDPTAIVERDFWKKVAKKHSHNELVEVVQYDSRKHRIWLASSQDTTA